MKYWHVNFTLGRLQTTGHTLGFCLWYKDDGSAGKSGSSNRVPDVRHSCFIRRYSDEPDVVKGSVE